MLKKICKFLITSCDYFIGISILVDILLASIHLKMAIGYYTAVPQLLTYALLEL